MKLREIAERLGCRLEGDGELEIAGVAGMENARDINSYLREELKKHVPGVGSAESH